MLRAERLCPWWSLPETIRAAALVFRATGDARAAGIWARADAAFFGRYWRAGHGIAYQTLGPDGPVDFTPATPDLDPGYHTIEVRSTDMFGQTWHGMRTIRIQ